MKEYFKFVLIGLGVLVLIIVIGLGLDFFLGVKWFGFVQPQKENIRREVFENTKSYVHGKVQDLANYYEQYQTAAPENRDAIRNVILMNFANFDTKQIDNITLRNFLTELRGY